MLRLFAHQVVKRRKEILLISLLLAFFGIIGMINQRINYDLLSYLPKELDSVKGMEILDEKFGMGTTVQLLLEDVKDEEVQKFKEEIEKIEGVEKVSWVTDFTDITVPREFWQEELVKNYYAKNTTLLQISFEESPTSPKSKKAFREIKELFSGKKAYMAGSLASSMDMEEVMKKDRIKYSIAALVLVSLVLVLTIPSIIVPLLFVVTIGLAVIYNLGLSFYLNQELSYLTGVVVFSLQFAVTMDYALFLYHRFEEEREKLPDEEAMEEAIVTTFKSVTTACLTTVAGFSALSAMRLGFGVDMGLTLARGVFITLLAVLTILPSLLLVFDPLIQKIAHRSFLPNFVSVSKVITRHSKIFALVFILLFIPAVFGYLNMEKSFDLHEGMPENLPSIKAEDVLAKKFGKQETAFLVIKDYDSLTELQETVKKVEKIRGVEGTFGYTQLVDSLIPEEFVPEEVREQFFKDGYTYYSVDIKYSQDDERINDVLRRISEVVQNRSSKTYLTGSAVLIKDLERVSEEDIGKVNYLSILAIFIIVLFAFRSLSVPLILVSTIELAILLNQGISTFTAAKVTFIAALAIGAIQLGATVDYAILLTSRYEEEMGKRRNRLEAIKKAVQESSQSILVSASTMFAATIGMVFLSNVGMIKGLATLISRGAIISFLVVVFLLPALLILSQPIFEWTGFKWPAEKRMRKRKKEEGLS
jgi:hypothetical protein